MIVFTVGHTHHTAALQLTELAPRLKLHFCVKASRTPTKRSISDV